MVAVNAKNIAVAGQTTTLFSGVPPRKAGNVSTWCAVWSQLGNSVVALTADGLEDIAHVSEQIDAKASPSV